MKRHLPDLAALAVVTIWGVNFVFTKAAFEEIDVLPFMFLRYAGMLALGWLVVAWHCRRSGTSPRIARTDLPRTAVTGVLGYSIYILLSMVGLEYTTAFSNALLIAVAPLFMAGLLWALRMERIRTGQVLAMLVSFTGVVIFLLDKAAGGFGAASAGDLISLVAAFFFAAYVVAQKPLLARYPAVVVTAWTLTIGAVPVLLLSFPSLFTQDWAGVSGIAWLTVLWSVILPVYVAWTVWAWVGREAGVARTSVYMYLVPLVGGVTAWLLLDEGFGPRKVGGALLTIAGLAVARWAAGRQSAPRPVPAAAPASS